VRAALDIQLPWVDNRGRGVRAWLSIRIEEGRWGGVARVAYRVVRLVARKPLVGRQVRKTRGGVGEARGR